MVFLADDINWNIVGYSIIVLLVLVIIFKIVDNYLTKKAPTITTQAKLTSKFQEIDGWSSSTKHYATFELLEESERPKFLTCEIKLELFGTLSENSIGKLEYKELIGERGIFVSFTPFDD